MNNKLKESLGFSLAQVLAIIGITAVCLYAGFISLRAAPTDTQGLAYSIYAPATQPATVTTLAVSNQTTVVVLRKGQGLGVAWNYTGATNATLEFFPWLDATGTNVAPVPWAMITTTNTLASVMPATKTITVTTNWSPAALAGYYGMNITISNGASVTLTNNGITVNVPN